MIFKFNRKRFSDVVKVVAYLDAEKIEYTVLTDIEVSLGGDEALAPDSTNAMEPTITPTKLTAEQNDPLWRVAQHDNTVCQQRACKDVVHYGATDF